MFGIQFIFTKLMLPKLEDPQKAKFWILKKYISQGKWQVLMRMFLFGEQYFKRFFFGHPQIWLYLATIAPTVTRNKKQNIR